MNRYPSDIAFSPAVKAIQQSKGSREPYARMEQGRGWQTEITPDLQSFLASLDMFYLGTSSSSGQPYIQYRGGPPGFLKPIDSKTLGWAEFGGNRQYISTGNLSENSQAFLFLMDYANRRRVKIWGTAQMVEGDLELNEQLMMPDYPADMERSVRFQIKAWDINCPQHIHPRILASTARSEIQRLQARIDELEK